MKISVFGLGYVGTVTAACLAKDNHTVLGVDINRGKVDMINAGICPVVEADIDVLVREAVEQNRLKATTSTKEAIENSQVSIICVGTPCQSNGRLDLHYVDRVGREIGKELSCKNSFHTVVLRSTVLPGTTRGTLIPVLEGASGKKAGADFAVCHNPEFLREGSSVYDFNNPPKIVIGEENASGEALVEIYARIAAPLVRTTYEVSEVVKYTDNLYHALKITFSNEIGNYCKTNSIDSHEVMDIFCLDTKLNISSAYLKPGFAFGGSCLPKDLRAIIYDAKTKDLSLPLLSSISRSNDLQIERTFDLIRRIGKKRIGFLGLSFKSGTDDLRESPLLELAERLLGKGYEITIYDRNIGLARLMGTNRDYLLEHLPHIETLLKPTLEEVVGPSDVLVFGNKEREFAEMGSSLLDSKIIVDLVRLFARPPRNTIYHGLCW